jgi:catechol 2,3-dioxygenase-like lactoylglutathione lyase family enzyme
LVKHAVGDLGLGCGTVQRVRIDRVNTVLYCDEWAPTVAFYRDTLGFDVVHEKDWFVEFRLTDDAFLSVADARRTTIEAVGGKGITLTLHTDALADTKAVLDGLGIPTTPMTRRWGADVFYCHDPEGHRIEFWSEAPPAG